VLRRQIMLTCLSEGLKVEEYEMIGIESKIICMYDVIKKMKNKINYRISVSCNQKIRLNIPRKLICIVRRGREVFLENLYFTKLESKK
jgi:hypothetical protein